MQISWVPSNWDYVGFGGLFILVLIILFYYLRKNTHFEELDYEFIKAEWQKIEQLMEFGKESNYKLAVIAADNLLDEVLKAKYFTGSTMAERLKLASYKYPKLKQVWWAHKARNQVVHEVRYTLKYNETKKILSTFKLALKELKAL